MDYDQLIEHLRFAQELGVAGVSRDRAWRQRFNADAAIIGRSVMVDGKPCEIVGVARPDFRFPDAETLMWTPLEIQQPSPDAALPAGLPSSHVSPDSTTPLPQHDAATRKLHAPSQAARITNFGHPWYRMRLLPVGGGD